MSEAVLATGRDDNGAMTREAVMRSAAHRSHLALGAQFERRGSWEVPAAYAAESKTNNPLRTSLGFADISARGKVHLSGDVDPLIRRLTRGKLEPLQTAAAGSSGLVARLARDWAIALVPPSGESGVMKAVEPEPADDSMVTDVTSAMSGFVVAGPRLEDFFARTLTLDPGELRSGRCAAATWAKIPAVLVTRDLAAPAVEIYVGSDHGRYAWETLAALCDRLGGSPVGWHALEAWGWA